MRQVVIAIIALALSGCYMTYRSETTVERQTTVEGQGNALLEATEYIFDGIAQGSREAASAIYGPPDEVHVEKSFEGERECTEPEDKLSERDQESVCTERYREQERQHYEW